MTADTEAMAAFAGAEQAKRRLIAELFELKLPIVGRDVDPQYGLAFDLLSSEFEKVFTGHEDGVITLDLAEGDDVHREQLRIAMDEPYRTLLGHFRHEIGHYYFYRLVGTSPRVPGAVSASCSVIPKPTTRRRWTGTTARARPPVGSRTTSRPTPPCTPPRTGPRRSPTTCTSATPWTPSAAFGIAPAGGDLRSTSVGPQRIRQHHRDVAAAGVVAEHGEPVDGPRRSLSVRAAAAGAGQDAFIHTVIDEVTSSPARKTSAAGRAWRVIDATFDHGRVAAAALASYDPTCDRDGAILAAARRIAGRIAQRAREQR